MSKNNYEKRYDRHPTVSLIIEAIGLLLVGIMIVHRLSMNSPKNIERIDIEMILQFIGLGLLVISFFGFCIFKQKNELYGIGKLGFVISVIAFVITILLVIFTTLALKAVNSLPIAIDYTN